MVATSLLAGPDAGTTVRFGGFSARYVVSAEQTDGAFALIEHELAPRQLGAPMHTHAREHEISHVTAGRLGVADRRRGARGRPGDTVRKPRGIPHAFWNPGDETVRFLELITPPGFEHYFADRRPALRRLRPARPRGARRDVRPLRAGDGLRLDGSPDRRARARTPR